MDNPGFTLEGKQYDNDLYVSIKAFWDQFEGEITHETTCTSCQNTTEIRALTTNLLLKFPDDDDNNFDEDCRVESLIKYHLQEECIEGYECSHCPQHTSATRKATITKFPSFLCILLCRKTEHDKNGYISSAVDFPTLGLKINRDMAYDLSATVYYKPTKSGKGHYTAISKGQALQSQHWYMYDDDKVSSCQFINKNNRVTKKYMKTATTLFYVTQECIKIKQLKAIDKLIMRLPPHSGKGCITNTQDDETIDEHINRIPTSEGLYMMHWILAQKAKSQVLDENQRKIASAKARSAVDRAMELLNIELSIEPNTKEHTIANSLAERKAFAIIKAHVEREQSRAIKESKANDKSNKDDNMDDKEEEEGSEEMDSSGGKESLTHNTVVNVASLIPTSHYKRTDAITELIMRLSPHSRQGCITFTQEGETIDEHINRIPTSEGLYKMHRLLTRKATNNELNHEEDILIRSKGQSAINRAMNLLASERNVARGSKEFNYLHVAAQQEAMIRIRKKGKKKQQEKSKERNANDTINKVDHMDAQQEENESEIEDSSSEEEDSSLFSESS